MRARGGAAAKRIVLETLGWLLVVGGIAALVLPGPGLLGLFAGLALLSQQYEWAERRLAPVKKKALEAAEDSVRTWPRIVASGTAAVVLVAAGVLWCLRPRRARLVAARRAVVALRWLGRRHHPDPLRTGRARP